MSGPEGNGVAERFILLTRLKAGWSALWQQDQRPIDNASAHANHHGDTARCLPQRTSLIGRRFACVLEQRRRCNDTALMYSPLPWGRKDVAVIFS